MRLEELTGQRKVYPREQSRPSSRGGYSAQPSPGKKSAAASGAAFAYAVSMCGIYWVFTRMAAIVWVVE